MIYIYIADEFETSKGSITLPECTLATSDCVMFFDQLFDSFNGRKEKKRNSVISDKTDHVFFWQETLRRLHSMEFVERTSHEPICRNAPKCIKNWVWTIRGALRLWQKVKRRNFASFNLRHINQDPLENFFSKIRDIGHRNNNPTPSDFAAAFKSLLIGNITSKHSPSSNCEEAGSSMSLLNMFHASKATSEEN